MNCPIENPMEYQRFVLVLQGSPLEQSLFVKRYGRLVRAVVSRYLDRQEDIEEVVQDAFLRAFKGILNFRGDCKLETWLSRVASSAALTRLRTLRKRIALEGYSEVLSEQFGETVDNPGLEQVEMHRWLKKALGHLNEKDQQVIQFFYLQEQSIQEICRATGWTESDVKSRLCRARRRLRTIIEERYRAVLCN